MTEQTSQDGQKTVVAFVAGLLVGGLLVWIFNDAPAVAPTADTESDTAAETGEQNNDEQAAEGDADNTAEAGSDSDAEQIAELPTGDGSAQVSITTAGTVVPLASATFPTDEGWVGVRTMVNGEVANILGAARYSKEQGLVPEEIQLLTPTIAGREYAIVYFTEDGDRQFNPRLDTQIDGPVTTFTAQ